MTIGSKLFLRFFLGLILLTACLFIPAGSLRFWQGWAYIALAFIPSGIAFLYFYRRDPQLIARRLQTKEKVSEQKLLIRVLKPFFCFLDSIIASAGLAPICARFLSG